MRYVGEVVGGPRYFQIPLAAGAGKEEYDIYDDDERSGEKMKFTQVKGKSGSYRARRVMFNAFTAFRLKKKFYVGGGGQQQ